MKEIKIGAAKAAMFEVPKDYKGQWYERSHGRRYPRNLETNAKKVISGIPCIKKSG